MKNISCYICQVKVQDELLKEPGRGVTSAGVVTPINPEDFFKRSITGLELKTYEGRRTWTWITRGCVLVWGACQ